MQDRLNSAAVAFAFDHGPLSSAGQGEVEALDAMGNLLSETLRQHGLKVVMIGGDAENSETT